MPGKDCAKAQRCQEKTTTCWISASLARVKRRRLRQSTCSRLTVSSTRNGTVAAAAVSPAPSTDANGR